jgi:hypothetical protein
MPEFRTEVIPNTLKQQLFYEDKVLLIGSCFSENIGTKFRYFGFNSISNPFGVVFNPISIANLLQRCIDKRLFEEKDIYFNQGRWFCFETHGDLAGLTKVECLKKHNEVLNSSADFLEQASCLIITFGSAWVYEHIETDNLVANCHKVPNTQFRKRLLSIDEIEKNFKQLIKNFERSTSSVQFIFTISPIRHWKDGVIENQRSKSLLHLAIQSLVEQYDNLNYFPAYEIMLDDLRDYRFYKEDMMHPNQQAVNYIWEKFKNFAIDESCLDLMLRMDKLRSSIAHRPFNEDSTEYQNFKDGMAKEVLLVKEILPHLEL